MMVAGLQPGEELPVVHTYRNAYGTHLECSSTCMLLLGMHVVLVVGGFLLLSVIPVRFATNEKLEAPFVLWFGSPKKRSKRQLEETQKEEVAEQTESLCRRLSSWLVWRTSSFFSGAPGRDVDMRYRFQADMTQQLAASAMAAKYDSIDVANDALEVKPPPYTDISVASGLEVESPHLTRPSSRSSISIAPPSPRSMSRYRQASTRSAGRAAISGRTSRAISGAVETKEDFMHAVTRRQSIAVRTERRATLAQEDVSYENLGDDEIRMYEYLSFVRELLDGLAIKKVCQKSGRVVSRTLYITPDMTTVFWNPAGTFKRLRTRSSIQTLGIEQVLKGIHGSANVTARSTSEREALCVSIRTSDGKWLVLEAKAEATRQRLFLGFSRLAQEKLEQEAAAAAEPMVGLEATIPEDRETEDDEALAEGCSEAALACDQKKQATSTYGVEATIKREEKLERLSEEKVELVAEQLEYEEKPTPPLPDESMLLQHEPPSIAVSYEEETSAVEDDGVKEYQSLERQEEDEHKGRDEEGITEELILQEQGVEGAEDVVPGDVSSNHDPERSRE